MSRSMDQARSWLVTATAAILSMYNTLKPSQDDNTITLNTPKSSKHHKPGKKVIQLT